VRWRDCFHRGHREHLPRTAARYGAHSLRPDFGRWGKSDTASHLRFPAMIGAWDVFSKYLSFVHDGSE
jgi:hypothetical protein